MKAMSKTFTIALTTFLTLFLYGNCFAFGNDSSYGIHITELGYNENNRLYAEVYLDDISYNEVFLSYMTGGYHTSRFDFQIGTNQHRFSTINNSGTIGDWKCPSGTPTRVYYGQTLYTILNEPIKCLLTSLYVSVKNYSGVSDQLADADGLTKSAIDTYFGETDFLENNLVIPAEGTGYNRGIFYYSYNGGDAQLDSFNLTATEPEYFPFAEYNPPVNGECGDANGQTYSYPPDEPPFDDWCNQGLAISNDIVYYGDYWLWHCYGLYGGTDDICTAYNSEPVDALCGLYEGNYYDEPPSEPEDFCELGDLIFPTFVETTLGWTWSCAGFNGGDNANCVAYKNIGPLPELPEQEDCSLLDVPDRWFCEISNSLKSIFLPDAEKINELQETINRINGRFPFNYLSVARTNFEDLQGETENDTITISLLDNEGSLNLEAVEPIADATKTASQGLFIFGFMFWAIGYIKHFFK